MLTLKIMDETKEDPISSYWVSGKRAGGIRIWKCQFTWLYLTTGYLWPGFWPELPQSVCVCMWVQAHMCMYVCVLSKNIMNKINIERNRLI